MSEERSRFARPIEEKRAKIKRRGIEKKPWRDNGLLFDRPWSYWTIAMLVIGIVFNGMRTVGTAPDWLALLAWVNAGAWVGVFSKGGGWAWIKEQLPKGRKDESDN